MSPLPNRAADDPAAQQTPTHQHAADRDRGKRRPPAVAARFRDGMGSAIAALGRPSSPVLLAVTLLVLIGMNLAVQYAPTWLSLLLAPLSVTVLVVLARRSGLTWDDLGLGRRHWRSGVLYGGAAVTLVCAVYVTGLLLPWTKSAFLDVRYNVAIGSAVVIALVVIPIKTVLLEEVAFRGVLLGMLRRPLGTGWSIAISSILFGLWHILPSLYIGEQNVSLDAVTGSETGSKILVVAGVVAFTALGGVVFAELRRRSGSLLAAVGLHWATNGLGVLLSSLLWATKAA